MLPRRRSKDNHVGFQISLLGYFRFFLDLALGALFGLLMILDFGLGLAGALTFFFAGLAFF